MNREWKERAQEYGVDRDYGDDSTAVADKARLE